MKKKIIIIILVTILVVALGILLFILLTKDKKMVCKIDNTSITIEYDGQTINKLVDQTIMVFDSADYAKYYYNLYNSDGGNAEYKLDNNKVIVTMDNSGYIDSDMTVERYRTILESRGYVCKIK